MDDIDGTDESQPRRLAVIGASAGGVQALRRLAAQLPSDFPAPILVVQHIGAHRSSLAEILSNAGNIPARFPDDGEPALPGRIYIAPSDHHMLVVDDAIRVLKGPKEHHARPAIDPLFRSAAIAAGPGAIGVVLTGLLDDGTGGLQAIKQANGVAVVQDPADAEEPSMPASALRHVEVDHCVPLDAIAALLSELVVRPVAPRRARPERELREQALFLARGDPMENLRAIGDPSPLVCPECHGGLWEVRETRPRRFRCHTGHAFTMRSLDHALATVADEAGWNALRAYEERAILLEEMAASAPDSAPDPRATAAAALSRSLKAQAGELRRIIEQSPDALE